MMLHPSENNKEGLVVGGAGGGGGGGGGREEAGLVVAVPAPFPTQPLRFHLVFVTRFVFSVIVVPSHAPGSKRFVLSEPFR